MSPLSRYILRNLAMRPLVTLVTLASLALTAFAVTAVSSAVLGLRQAFVNTGSPTRLYVMTKGTDVPFDSNLNHEQVGQVTTAPEIKRVSSEYAFIASFVDPHSFSHEDMPGYGIDDSAYDMYNLQLLEGRLPNRGAPEVVVGVTLRDRHPEAVKVGNTINLYSGRPYTIVGIVRTGTLRDSEVFGPRDAISLDNKSTDVSRVVLDVGTPAEATELAEKLTAAKFNVAAFSESSYLERFLSSFRPIVLNVVLTLLFVVAGAALAATSTLLVIFRQRIAEMAVLRALGFRSVRVIGLMIKEALFLALAGGAVGAAAATLLLRGRTEYVEGTLPLTFHSSVTPVALVVTLVTMVLVGLVAVVGPIVNVTRLQIKDALREGA